MAFGVEPQFFVMEQKKKEKKDISGAVGAGATATGAAAGGATVAALAGGSASASAITYALGAIGSVVGGGMAAGLGVLIGGPAILGAGAYAVTKAIQKKKK